VKKAAILYNTLAWVLLLIPSLLFSQSVITEYGLKEITQTSAQNPAFRPEASFVLGLPVLSSVSGGFYNTAFTFNEIFIQNNNDDSLYFDLSQPINKMNAVNYFSENITVDLISLGFKTGNSFLTFGIRSRLSSRVFYSPDLLALIWNGNGQYINQELNLKGSAVYQEHLNNYYMGISFPVSHNVDLGFRMNFLQGLSNINTNISRLSLLTKSSQETGYEFVAQTDFNVETTGISELMSDSSNFSASDYFINFSNIGFALDVGADIRFNNQFSIQASVVDLGSVFWYGNPAVYSSKENDITFSGIQYDFNTENDKNAFDTYMDSLSTLLHVEEDNRVYSASLRTKIFLNGQYFSLDNKHRLNVLFAGRFLEETFEYALSLGYTYAPSEKFAVKVAYNYLKYAPLNIGLGFYFNLKPFQFYFSTDSIISLFRVYDMHYANAHFGINILIPYVYKELPISVSE
jgi:hypothetical protein